MSHYLIGHFDIADRDTFHEYVTKVMPLLDTYNGKVIVGGDTARVLEGEQPDWSIVIEFPTEDEAINFYNDPTYEAVKAIRLDATSNHYMVHAPSFTYA